MSAQVSMMLDKRRVKKEGKYPLKLRVYDNGDTQLYQTIYDLSSDEHEKFGTKRVSDSLEKIRGNVREIEPQAISAANKIVPFDFEKFYQSFIKDNSFFLNKKKKAILKTTTYTGLPEDWKSKFSIFKEPQPGSEYISNLYINVITGLVLQGRIGTAFSYQSSYKALKKFKGIIRITEITPQLLKEFEGWMINLKKKSKTTVGFYTRALRAIVNEAIELKLMNRDNYPFGRRRYRIPTGRNIKKALDKPSISKLYYSETECESQQRARDFCFFSFYGNGMNIKDIVRLKFKNIQGEYLVFERAKTEMTTRGREPIIISCFITTDMWGVIKRWGNKDQSPDNYLFPILEKGMSPIREYEVRNNFIQYINKNMAKICEVAKIDKKVRTMETRHSSSTIMKNAGLSPHYIKEALGHASLQTTENYLAGFENEQRKEFSKVLEEFKKNN